MHVLPVCTRHAMAIHIRACAVANSKVAPSKVSMQLYLPYCRAEQNRAYTRIRCRAGNMNAIITLPCCNVVKLNTWNESRRSSFVKSNTGNWFVALLEYLSAAPVQVTEFAISTRLHTTRNYSRTRKEIQIAQESSRISNKINSLWQKWCIWNCSMLRKWSENGI